MGRKTWRKVASELLEKSCDGLSLARHRVLKYYDVLVAIAMLR